MKKKILGYLFPLDIDYQNCKNPLGHIHWCQVTHLHITVYVSSLTFVFQGTTTALFDNKMSQTFHQTGGLGVSVSGVCKHLQASVSAVGSMRLFQVYYL